MTFSLSNFMPRVPALRHAYRAYRLTLAGTLIGFLLTGLIAMADSSDDYWPNPVYFPQKSEQSNAKNPPSSKSPTEFKPKKEKKDWWPFNNHRQQQLPIPTEDQIIKVGPKDPPASPYPLLRLPMPIQTGQGLINAGIYLLKPVHIKQNMDTTTSADSKSPTPPIPPKTLLLTQRDRLILQFEAKPIPNPDPNVETEGTPSPLSKKEPELPTPMRARIKLAPDGRSLAIQILENGQAYESPAFPTVTDLRKNLTY